ncbi:MAG: ATP-binding cassette domain-containing protein [Ignavibacteriales bacterium]|nr:ATP-binding cassette domain-containing protein [Ignavibacteriales bacterium]
MILIENIWKQFSGKQVHRGISFDVREKETLVVLGKSGGGKSVLLKMVIGLIKPDAGRILVDGKNVVEMTYPELRALRFKFGFLFQGAALFDSMTVGENIALSLRRHADFAHGEIRDRIDYALHIVGLDNVQHVMPSSLSGGMKKRVGLARSIALTPRYMLYDEPTTGLDVATADGINLLINELRSSLGVTSIVVTHDIHSAFVVGDRFAVLEKGETLMTGTREEIQNSDNEEVRKYINSSISPSESGHA